MATGGGDGVVVAAAWRTVLTMEQGGSSRGPSINSREGGWSWRSQVSDGARSIRHDSLTAALSLFYTLALCLGCVFHGRNHRPASPSGRPDTSTPYPPPLISLIHLSVLANLKDWNRGEWPLNLRTRQSLCVLPPT